MRRIPERLLGEEPKEKTTCDAAIYWFLAANNIASAVFYGGAVILYYSTIFLKGETPP